jgi:hypothetical protein
MTWTKEIHAAARVCAERFRPKYDSSMVGATLHIPDETLVAGYLSDALDQLEEVMRVLRSLEWSGTSQTCGASECPYCTEERVHTADCDLAKLIGAKRREA